jgi:outer membrane protein assembly factor BamE (lipoprotein component of BamABCDE complex)
MMKTTAVVFASLLLVAGASGCKTTSSAEGGSEKAAPAKAEKAEKSQKNVKQAPANIPASSPLAKIKMGMQRAQVDDLIGEPTSTRVFPSGKAFIPFYYGPDTVRTGAFYKGIGRIVFSGAHQVVEIEYDPTEDGY